MGIGEIAKKNVRVYLPNRNEEYVDHVRQSGALSAPGVDLAQSIEIAPCRPPGAEEEFKSRLEGDDGIQFCVVWRKGLLSAAHDEGGHLDLA